MTKTTVKNRFILALTILLFIIKHISVAQTGITWASQKNVPSQSWTSVTYGNGMFVAVATSHIGKRVMTSPYGKKWTLRNTPANNNWNCVTFGNGVFVAVASANSGIGNRVMRSTDGITWTSQTSAAENNWSSVTFGNGLFVAVAYSGTGNRVMTSPDGITWTSRTSAADNGWSSITFGNNLFVAVAGITGTTNRVMTSPDGFNWAIQTAASANDWSSVTFGNGKFVAVSNYGADTNRVMTSADGITWTSQNTPADQNIPAEAQDWNSITYGNGLFVAVTGKGTGNRVMTSSDGIIWTSRFSAKDNAWTSITYANGVFVAVASTGTGDNVMTSGCITTDTIETVRSCGSYTWRDGNTYTSNNNTATDTLTNFALCDSIIKLNLIMAAIDNGTTVSGGTITAKQSSASYRWLNCNNANAVIPSETSKSFSPTINGSYAVEITLGTCKDTSTCVSFNSIGISESKEKIKFAVYPNPANELITVESNIMDGTIIISDVNGKQVLTQTFNATKTNINTSALSNGIYLMQILDSSNMIQNRSRIVLYK